MEVLGMRKVHSGGLGTLNEILPEKLHTRAYV